MRVNRWYLTAVILLCGIIASWTSTLVDQPRPLALGVVAARPLTANHKVTADDLSFSLVRTSLPEDALDSPDGATGACTIRELKKDDPVTWQHFVPQGASDGSCANAALPLKLAEIAAKIPVVTEGVAAPGAIAPAPKPVADGTPDWVKVFENPPAQLDPATRLAMGEFRSEFVKEFGKHLADNVADRIFGRDSRPAPAKTTDRPPPPKPETKPEPIRLSHVSRFEFNKSDLTAGEHDALVEFAKELQEPAGCQVTVNAFADRTGKQIYNLWLSWQRGNTVTAVLVDRRFDRRRIVMVPHGYEEPSVGGVADQPTPLNRRVEIEAVCPPRPPASP